MSGALTEMRPPEPSTESVVALDVQKVAEGIVKLSERRAEEGDFSER